MSEKEKEAIAETLVSAEGSGESPPVIEQGKSSTGASSPEAPAGESAGSSEKEPEAPGFANFDTGVKVVDALTVKLFTSISNAKPEDVALSEQEKELCSKALEAVTPVFLTALAKSPYAAVFGFVGAVVVNRLEYIR